MNGRKEYTYSAISCSYEQTPSPLLSIKPSLLRKIDMTNEEQDTQTPTIPLATSNTRLEAFHLCPILPHELQTSIWTLKAKSILDDFPKNPPAVVTPLGPCTYSSARKVRL